MTKIFAAVSLIHMNTGLIADGGLSTYLRSLITAHYRQEGDATCSSALKAECLNLSHPELVLGAHSDFMSAGARWITTNTFMVNPDYPDLDRDLCDRMIIEGVMLAKKAIASGLSKDSETHKYLIAGSLASGTIPISSIPDKTLKKKAEIKLYSDLYRNISSMISSEPDILLFETIYDAENLRILTDAIADLKNVGVVLPPVAASVISSGHGFLNDDSDIDILSRLLSPLDPAIVGINCCEATEDCRDMIIRMKSHFTLPILFRPNADLRTKANSGSWISPAEFSDYLMPLLYNGIIDIAGGCCGITPAHISSLSHQ